MTDPLRYYGSTYCCPACTADTAARVSEEELALITGYIKLRGEARELIRQRIAESRTK